VVMRLGVAVFLTSVMKVIMDLGDWLTKVLLQCNINQLPVESYH